MSTIDNKPIGARAVLDRETLSQSSDADSLWDGSGLMFALALVLALIIVGIIGVGIIGEKSLNYWVPNTPPTTTGVLIDQSANVHWHQHWLS
jgi:hypothetical protein